MKQEYSKKRFYSTILAVVLSVFVVVSGVTAATTISTNINTGGTLTVTGVSTLTGASTLTGGITVGSSGTAVTQLIKGSCTTWNGGIAAGINGMDGNHPASTTEAYDCAVTGAVSGDLVFAQFATSTFNGSAGQTTWLIAGAKASSTSGYITVLITNYGPAAVPSVTGVGSSTSYLIIR